jgi:RNA polymerase sigma factor (sigma-70 family)
VATEPDRYPAGVRTRVLFERHGRMVLGLCRVLLRDAEEAEDAAQQTFLDAHRGLLGGTVVRDEAAWLAAIARHECRARIVARMREPLALTYGDLVEAAGAAAPEDTEALSDEVRGALAELPAPQRQAVVLRDVYGLRYREVAVALGLSQPAVESVLFRARRRLRTRLRPVAGPLVVPMGLRESLAQTLPGFTGGEGAAVAGVAGATGVLVKLGSGPVAAKLAAGAVAVGAGGGSLAVTLDDGDRDPPRSKDISVVRRAAIDAGRVEHAVSGSVVTAAAVTERRRDAADGDRSGPGDGGERDRRGDGGGHDGDGSSSSRGGGGLRSRDPESGSSGSGPGSGLPGHNPVDDDGAAADDSTGHGGSASPGVGPGPEGSHSGSSEAGSGGSAESGSDRSGPGSGPTESPAAPLEPPSSGSSGAVSSGSSGSGSGPGSSGSGSGSSGSGDDD